MFIAYPLKAGRPRGVGGFVVEMDGFDEVETRAAFHNSIGFPRFWSRKEVRDLYELEFAYQCAIRAGTFTTGVTVFDGNPYWLFAEVAFMPDGHDARSWRKVVGAQAPVWRRVVAQHGGPVLVWPRAELCSWQAPEPRSMHVPPMPLCARWWGKSEAWQPAETCSPLFEAEQLGFRRTFKTRAGSHWRNVADKEPPAAVAGNVVFVPFEGGYSSNGKMRFGRYVWSGLESYSTRGRPAREHADGTPIKRVRVDAARAKAEVAELNLMVHEGRVTHDERLALMRSIHARGGQGEICQLPERVRVRATDGLVVDFESAGTREHFTPAQRQIVAAERRDWSVAEAWHGTNDGRLPWQQKMARIDASTQERNLDLVREFGRPRRQLRRWQDARLPWRTPRPVVEIFS
jgi:hypothetical protein